MTVQLCDQCGRVPVVVGDRAAYSVERGNLIVRHGYCGCRTPVNKPRPQVEGDRKIDGTGAHPIAQEALEGAGARYGW
jgi:hypothetical protein